MKDFIDFKLKYHSQIFPSVGDILAHMFSTNGNGINLNNKGFINENHGCKDVYPFGKPTPLSSIYPWSKDERYQPFRKLAGCRDIGFKESAKHFIECLKITPDTVEGITGWKNNIHIVEDVLLNTPEIVDEFMIGDIYKFLKKIEKEETTSQAPVDPMHHPEVPPNSVSKVWFFDAQWSDCPDSVRKEVSHIWKDFELGNDNYIYKTTVDLELFNEYPHVFFWLKHKGVADNENVIIHYWW